ncbi:hypothetical protein PoB_002684400 [Plakobranchus ocellatus]|uniref:Uncharacterized protein n=1 Tax=Plakobranchus ocellatus TaxID=259542 RepID=A0AAV4A179_9GAST|nr:hypothetical protein PoB_002684400 [Plakobranchus ocellatus]
MDTLLCLSILPRSSRQRVWDLYWDSPNPYPEKIISRLGSRSQCCPPVSAERSGQRCALMSDNHYFLPGTDSPPPPLSSFPRRRIIFEHTQKNRTVGQKTKQSGEKVMAPMYQRESIHQRQSILVASHDSHSTVSRFLPSFHSRRKRSKEQQEEGREEKSKVEKK